MLVLVLRPNEHWVSWVSSLVLCLALEGTVLEAAVLARFTVELQWANSCQSFSGGSAVKNPPANTGDTGIPGSERSPGEGNGNPLQYSCLKNSMDRGVWWVTVQGVTKSQIQLSDFHFIFPNQMFLWNYMSKETCNLKMLETKRTHYILIFVE